MTTPTIGIVFPNALAVADGIADHTRSVAAELVQRGYAVTVFGRGEGELPKGVEYVDAWPTGRLRDVGELRRAVVGGDLSLVLLQFEQFSYGYRGYNPELSSLFSDLKKTRPQIVRALYAHETYTVPQRHRPLGTTAMWSYQRKQVAKLVRDADLALFSSQVGARRLGKLNADSAVLPVFSNIPVSPPVDGVRGELNIPDRAFTVFVFGHLGEERTRFIRSAFERISAARRDALLVYVGKDPGGARRLVDEPKRLQMFISRSEEDVSRLLRCADLALAPFLDGVSARRGSFIALLAHQVPVVTTRGRDTDAHLITAASAGAFELTAGNPNDFASAAARLAADDGLRLRIRNGAARAALTLPTSALTADVLETVLARKRPHRGR